MIDLAKATQDAIYDALNVAAVTALAPVYQHVPENQQPPIVIVSDISAEAAGGKDGGLDRMTIEILTLVREPRRASLYTLQNQVRTALEDVTLPAQAGAELSRPTFIEADDSLLDDGQTYLGTQRFSLFAQPA